MYVVRCILSVSRRNGCRSSSEYLVFTRDPINDQQRPVIKMFGIFYIRKKKSFENTVDSNFINVEGNKPFGM